MSQPEEVGFIDRKGLKKAETRNKQQISHFKITFFVRQGQEDRAIIGIITAQYQVTLVDTFFVSKELR
jgi:hypothetical protein